MRRYLKYSLFGLALLIGAWSAATAQMRIDGIGRGITTVGTIRFADGSAAAPSITFASDPDTGFFATGTANQIGFTTGGSQRSFQDSSSGFVAAPHLFIGATDLTLRRGAANQLDLGSGDSFSIVLGKLGYGAQTVDLAGVTTLALTAGSLILTCDGAEQLNTITGGLTGMTLVIQHGDTECTIDDDDAATATDAIDLVGTATDDVGAVNKVIVLFYNGSHWLQVTESDN